MPDFSKHGYNIVPASKWVLLEDEDKELLRRHGGFPVNDKFIELWQRPDTDKLEILFPYGTYGSGKTFDRCQELILLAIVLPYFNCFYVRKTLELAKKEFHKILIDAIRSLNVEHLFKFSEEANGTKDIVCIANHNRFQPFGCDEIENIKGIKDPSHIFIDEVNQIEYKAFARFVSRLRKKGAKKCLIGNFNNCDVFDDHWLASMIFNDDFKFVDDKGVEMKLNFVKHFSLYTDNHFIDHEDYRNQLVLEAGDDPERLNAILTGGWGAKTTGQPFYKQFKRSLHVGKATYNPKLCLHVSFDENVNPYLPVGIFQIDGHHLYCIDEIAAKNPYNTLRWVCNEIVRRYGENGLQHESGMIIYGDATSVKEDTKQEKGKNFFTLAKEYLKCFHPKLRVSKSNPNVNMRGNFINDIFQTNIYGLFIVIDYGCKTMIEDLVHTSESPDGNGKDKHKETVAGIRGVQPHSHFSDLFDYVICEAWRKYYDTFRKGNKSPKMVVAKRVARNSF